MTKRIDDKDLEEVSGAGDLQGVEEKEASSVFHPPGGGIKPAPDTGGGDHLEQGDTANQGSGGDTGVNQG